MNSGKLNKIPVSKISEQSRNGIVFRYIFNNEQVTTIDHVHQDDYYMFILLEEGEYRACIDFNEYKLNGLSIAFISPGQIHFITGYKNVTGYVIGVDTVLINHTFKEVFEKVSVSGNLIVPDIETFENLKSCLSVLHKKIQSRNDILEQNLVYALVSSFIGLVAEMYHNDNLGSLNKRSAIITHQFRKLLSNSYQTVKSPSQYASKLNLSLSYLNEVVKETTNLTVSQCIQNEIILQAKRLLFYTNMTIKEIAYELGFEDHTYFTRLFTKVAGISPTKFKVNYRQ
ncbi:helix-turn-helix domain-containing protein [Abyssalbus ytuae]|uniref:AraC family transcriptional regulator n=1 Tax=Abyssalbus ytuae TaxID=2926907 RepID=A0A9E7A1E1_9FLAO|nr:AraC family transcriptional regulator [Abyssalbus ytuae]UOB17961.1 AraC family transcriptional regulator [Abyssalbus ytuae]